MKVGYLYQKDEKEVKKDVEKNIDVSLGCDVGSIMDTIILHEINNPGNPNIVISLLKKELMLILGKAEIGESKNEN